MQEKLKLFVSHIHEESRLGATIKDALEDALPDRVAVFVSSDRRDNPGGEQWPERIARELKDPQTRMLVSLVSPQALCRPWISVELGAVWVLGRAVFPLCHSGQKLGELPRPLQDFGGADLASVDAAARLINAVEKATGLRVPRRWPIERFLVDMRNSVDQAQQSARPGPPIPSSSTIGSAESHTGVPEEQVRILRRLAQAEESDGRGIPVNGGARECELRPVVFLYHVGELEKRNLLCLARSDDGRGGAHWKLTPGGAGWLIEQDLMPESGLR